MIDKNCCKISIYHVKDYKKIVKIQDKNNFKF